MALTPKEKGEKKRRSGLTEDQQQLPSQGGGEGTVSIGRPGSGYFRGLRKSGTFNPGDKRKGIATGKDPTGEVYIA